MVDDGGNSVGCMRIERSRNEISIETKPLIEYADEEQIKKYLEDLLKTAGKRIAFGNEA